MLKLSIAIPDGTDPQEFLAMVQGKDVTVRMPTGEEVVPRFPDWEIDGDWVTCEAEKAS